MLLPSIVKLGTLFERSSTGEDGFNAKGNCSICIRETVNRLSGLHASRSQVLSSAARTVAMYSVPFSCSLAVYAQPPCALTSPMLCSAETSLTAISNAAKHAPPGMIHDARSPPLIQCRPFCQRLRSRSLVLTEIMLRMLY